MFLVPDFRRDDVWIPAFAGTTFLEVAFRLEHLNFEN